MLAGQFAPLALAAAPKARPAQAAAAPAAAPPSSAAPQPAVTFDVGGPSDPAPIITATKVDDWDDSGSPDGKADPGQTITYTVTIKNTGTADATGVLFSDQVDTDTTYVAGSAVASVTDAYTTIGNVQITVPGAQGLLVNDFRPETGNNTGLTASGGTTSANGGTVSISSDGGFTYDPPTGFNGTDTFNYTTTDPSGHTATSTAKVTVTGKIWFVNNNAGACTSNCDGRLSHPFTSLANFQAVNDGTAGHPGDGDTVFLYESSASYAGPVTLRATQKFVGQDATDSLIAITGYTQPSGTDPLPAMSSANATKVTVTSGSNAINLGTDNALRGFTVGLTTGAKISGSSFGTLTVGKLAAPDVSLTAGGQALNLSSGAFAATSAFNGVTTTGSTGAGVSLSAVSGTVAFGGTGVSGAATDGIFVTGSSADINFGDTIVSGGINGVSLSNNGSGTRTFGTLTVSGGSGIGFRHFDPDAGGAQVGGGNTTVGGTASVSSADNAIDIQGMNAGTAVNFQSTVGATRTGAGGAGVNLVGNAATITFNSLGIQTNAGTGLNATNGGTINVTNASGTINNTTQTAPAVVANGVTLNANFSAIKSSGGTNGVSLTNVSGTSNFGTCTLSGASSTEFLVSGGSANVTCGGTVSHSSQRVVSVDGTTGGAINFTGTVEGTASSTGVIINNANGNVSFNTLNLGTDPASSGTRLGSQAVTITNGTGTYSLGTVSIFTNNASAIVASGADGTINSTAGTINTTGATALSITGPGGVTTLGMVLTKVTASGGPNGIVLSTTNGSFAVNGDGTNARNGSGGTISNTTDDGVRLTSANNVTLKSMNFTNTGNVSAPGTELASNESTTGEHAVEINGGSNVILSAITVTTPGGSGVVALNVAGTSRINLGSLFTAINSTNSHAVFFKSTTVSNTLFEINDTDFKDSTSAASTVYATNGPGSANVQFDIVNGSLFNNLSSQAVTIAPGQDIGAYTGTFTSNVKNSTFSNANGTAENNLGVLVNNNATHVATVESNLFDNIAELGDIAGTSIIRTQNSGGKLTATVKNNTIQNINYPTSAAGGRHVIGHIFEPSSYNAANFSNITIDGNTATNVTYVNTNREFVVVDFRQFSSGGSVKVINNNWNMPSAGGQQAIELRFRPENSSNVGILVSNNGNGSGAVHNTTGRFLDIDAEESAQLQTTVTNNHFTDQETATGTGIAVTTEDNAAPGGSPTHCVNISGNTLTGTNSILLSEGAGSMTVTQANSSALSTANGGAAVTVTGTPTFGQPACTVPSAPQSFSAASTPTEATTVKSRVTRRPLIMLPSPVSTARPAARNEAAEDETTARPDAASSDVQQSPVSRPAETARPATRTKAAKPLDLKRAKRNGGTVFRHTDADSSAPLVTEPFAAVQGKPVVNTTTPRPRVDVVGTNGSGGTVTANIGTLHPGDTVTITFQVTIDSNYTGGPFVSNQGSVTGTNFAEVLTDDPTPPANGAADPTLTPINVIDVRVNGATVSETTSTTQLLFTVTLSGGAPASGITVGYTTEDDTGGTNLATAGNSCGGSVDYVTKTGTLIFAQNERFKTVAVDVCADTDSPEPSETLRLKLTSVSSGNILNGGTAVGTITQGNAAGTFIISELRTRGPGGDGDDFVELYNNTDAPLVINDPSGGYGVFKMGADCNAAPVLIATVPNGTIPARAHYLIVGTQYSLSNYGGTGAAAGDQTIAPTVGDIEDDHNVAVFSTADVNLLSSATRLDAVGFNRGGPNDNSGVCALLKEGTTLPAVTGTTTEHTFFRKECGFVENVGCAIDGYPKDANDNAADFFFADTAGTSNISGVTPRLGAPGPENSSSPVRSDTLGIAVPLLDRMVASSASINRDRDFNSQPMNNAQFGTMTIRRRIFNGTGSTVTRLRVRIIEITTGPSASVPPGAADLRALTSLDATVQGVKDPATCFAATGSNSTPCDITVKGTTLEQPPTQNAGGGYNSTMSVPLPGGGLPDQSSVNVQFVLGVQQTGKFRFYIIVEALKQ